MDFHSCAWMWMYFGAFLMLSELLAPGFVMVFFGLSALTVGIVRFILGEAFDGIWQFVAFSGFAILYLVFLRKWMKRIFVGSREESKVDFDHETVGRLGKVTAAIAPPLAGRVLIGDAEWTAVADTPIAEGSDVKVVSQNNLTMKVRKMEVN